jgi:hypothetical protein
MNKIKEWLKTPFTSKELKASMITMALFFIFDLGSAIFEFIVHLDVIGWFDIGASLCCLAVLLMTIPSYLKSKGGK